MRSIAVAGAALLVVLLPTAAMADDDGEQQITHYAESVVLDDDGTAHVSLDLTLDFADVPGHGPFLSIPVREVTDDGRTRVYTVDDVTASSPSGAPAGVSVEDNGDTVELRVGDPDVDDVDGVQTYTVAYTVTGLINTDTTTGDGDQLYWDPVGPDWELPLADVTVSVSGPGAAERARCFAGEVGATTPCSSADVTKTGATFSQASLEPGEVLTVVAGWPAGTFPAAHAVFEPSDDSVPDDGLPEDFDLDENGNPSFVDDFGSVSDGGFGTAFSGVAVFIGLAAVAVVVSIVVALVRGASTSKAPPPQVVSLAKRGYLRIDPMAPASADGRANWMLVPLRPADAGLSARERAWYAAMFAGGMVPVYWSNVRPPVEHHSAFSGGSGFGGGGGGGFGGDAGAGGGAGGGGGGSW